MPVIYDRRVSGGLLGHLAGAINGRGVARGTSFLKDKMGEQIFDPGHPHRRRSRTASAASGSRPFEAKAWRPSAAP